jgi:hypothetical protein
MKYSVFFNRDTKLFWFKGYKTKTSSRRAIRGIEEKTKNNLYNFDYTLNEARTFIKKNNNKKY